MSTFWSKTRWKITNTSKEAVFLPSPLYFDFSFFFFTLKFGRFLTAHANEIIQPSIIPITEAILCPYAWSGTPHVCSHTILTSWIPVRGEPKRGSHLQLGGGGQVTTCNFLANSQESNKISSFLHNKDWWLVKASKIVCFSLPLN